MSTNKNKTIQKTRKLVVVGDGMSGKTCLLYAYIYNTFDPTHTPTIFDTYAAEIQVDEKKVSQCRKLFFYKIIQHNKLHFELEQYDFDRGLTLF
jgi:small GTP-binding protein